MTHEIRGGVVLPARREDVELHTADGLTLVGELALPLEGEPVATLVTWNSVASCAAVNSSVVTAPETRAVRVTVAPSHCAVAPAAPPVTAAASG